jgi:two-component system, NarL family, response regulator NreC
MTISILLADDHTILRQGLAALLEAEPDFAILGEASTGLETLQKVFSLDPDVLVLDLALPDINGLEITRQVHSSNPRTCIVILSMHAKEAYVFEAFNSGASAYVLKGSDARELIQAIRRAKQGVRYLSPPLNEQSLEAYIEQTRGQDFDPFETLTNRERQILHLAAGGCSNNEIARRLTISPRTVEAHRAKVMAKLNLHNQSELVRFAIQHNIIPLDVS